MEFEWIWKATFLLGLLILPISGAPNVIRVRARNYEPFIYQNSTNGQFYEGIEFHLIQAIAKKLGMKDAFQLLSSELNLSDTK